MYSNEDIEMSLAAKRARGRALRSASSAKLVIIESPFAGNLELNVAYTVAYARAAMRDSILRGENPYASHLLFTQPDILNDDDEYERELGIELGLAWGMHAELTAVYTDLGVSSGMRKGILAAKEAGRKVIARSLGTGWKELVG